MKGIVRAKGLAGLFILCAALVTPLSARADLSQLSYNEGRFTVTAPSSWVMATDIFQGETLWAVRPGRQRTLGAWTVCHLREVPSAEHRSQAEANAHVARWTFESFREATASRQRLQTLSNDEVGGVQVLTVSSDRNYLAGGVYTPTDAGRVFRSFERHFVLARDGQEQAFLFMCTAPMPISQQDRTAIDAVLGSLTFTH